MSRKKSTDENTKKKKNPAAVDAENGGNTGNADAPEGADVIDSADEVEKSNSDSERKKANKKRRKGRVIDILLVVFSALSAFIAAGINWVFSTWGNLKMDELIFTLSNSTEGTDIELIKSGVLNIVTPTVIAFLLALLVVIVIKMKKRSKIITRIVVLIVCIAAVTSQSVRAWNQLEIGEFIKSQTEYTTFIEDNYVDPDDVEITFPETKRNLILIYVESIEVTFTDEENGGAFSSDMIPELTALAEENEDFSGSYGGLTGAYAMPGCTWTMGGLFATSTGLPLKLNINGDTANDEDTETNKGENIFSTQDEFFPSLTTLGDILEDEGYNQVFMIGSNASFGGRELWYSSHGDYEIMDYNYAIDQQWIDEDYKVFWGYEDEKLFEYAKEELTALAEEDEPFNFTTLTVDTHFPSGYECDNCPDTYGDNQLANAYACASDQISEFVEWIQAQDFYEDTTIVITGDHLTMSSSFCDDVDESYTRKTYTAYINSAVEPENAERERTYTTMDHFPTILASLGVDIEGDRLGLGTNLFSDTDTMIEEYGYDDLKTELAYGSEFMEDISGIDEDSYAVKVRSGNIPSATVKLLNYSEGMARISISNIKYNGVIDNIEVRVIVDDETLYEKYYDTNDTGEYTLEVYARDVVESSSTGSIKVYVNDEGGNAYVIKTFTADDIEELETTAADNG